MAENLDSDEDVDAHLCLACQGSFIGLASYIEHKTRLCPFRKIKKTAVTLNSYISTTTQVTSSTTPVVNTTPLTGPAQDLLTHLPNLGSSSTLGLTSTLGLSSTLQISSVLEPSTSQGITSADGIISVDPNEIFKLGTSDSLLDPTKDFFSSLDLQVKTDGDTESHMTGVTESHMTGVTESHMTGVEHGAMTATDNQLISNEVSAPHSPSKLTRIWEKLQLYSSDSEEDEECSDNMDDSDWEMPSSGGKWTPGGKVINGRPHRKYVTRGKWKPGMGPKRIRVRTAHKKYNTRKVRQPSFKLRNCQEETGERSDPEEKPVECMICNETAPSSLEMAQHLVTSRHIGNCKDNPRYHDSVFENHIHALPLSQYNCTICRFYCNKFTSWVEHCQSYEHTLNTNEIIEKKNLVCSICNQVLKNNEKYVDHIKSTRKHKNRKSEQFILLTIAEHKAMYHCFKCNSKYGTKKSLRIHVRTEHALKMPHYCFVCQKSFYDGYTLRRHREGQHHNKRETLRGLQLAKKVQKKGLSAPEKPKTLQVHSCKFCAAKFDRKKDIKEHTLSAHCSQVYECDLCDKKYITKKELKHHKALSKQHSKNPKHFVKVKSKTSPREMYKCRHCDETCDTYHKLRSHFLLNHVDCQFGCQKCGVSFKDSESLKNHQASCTSVNESRAGIELVSDDLTEKTGFHCQPCGEYFSDQVQLDMHNIIHVIDDNEKKIYENPPPPIEPYREFLEQRYASNKSVTCPICVSQEEPIRKAKVKKHCILQHLGHHFDLRFYSCPLCTMQYRTKRILRRHIMYRHFQKVHLCDFCGVPFSNKASLYNHVYRKHPMNKSAEKDENAFYCEICGNDFASLQRVNMHKKMVHEKYIACSWEGCRFKCSSNSTLTLHVRTHTKEKPFQCEQCSYTTAQKSKLNRHALVHTGERKSQYRCQYCSFHGKNQPGLSRHMRIHTGSKPYHCPHCTYVCNCIENLRKHILTNKQHKSLDLMIYNCKKCPYATNNAKVYSDHIVAHGESFIVGHDILSEIAGLYFPAEDLRKPLEGQKIIPAKEEKYQHVRMKRISKKTLDENNLFLVE